ncbi:MAG: ribosome-associated translation inhibitor RaiA [Candidatus Gastranaerophilales bacterium]|nr:ribosome-associated translation inhibitor RaiA [Candidatus Gastranaerophilales bacterium]
MQIIVNGRNIEITPAIKAYVKEKMAKVVEHYDQLIDFEVILTVIKNPSVADSHVAEAKCNIAGARIHIEEKAESMYASIDLLADKLNRQVQKYKDKVIKGKHKADSIRTASNEEAEETEEATVE